MKKSYGSPRLRGFVSPLAFIAAGTCLIGSVIAQSVVTQLQPVVTSATRTPTDPAAVTATVMVIDPHDLDEAQVADLPAALASAPGVSVVQTGGQGGPTSVFMRGGGSSHTLFYVDGVRLNTADAAYFNALGATGLDGIDRIEVLNGPQSTLYGSSALGGVVVVETQRGRRDRVGTITAEAGSFDTYRGSLQVAGRDQIGRHSFSLSTVSTNNDRPLNEFDQLAYSGRFEGDATDDITVGLTLRGWDIADGAPGSVGSSFIGETDTHQHLSTIYGEWQGTDHLVSRLTYGWFQQEYHYTPVPPPVGSPWDTAYYSRDTRNILDWQNSWDPADAVMVVAGLNFETEGIHAVTPTVRNAYDNDSAAAYALGTWQPQPDTTLLAGARYDDFDNWGTATTWKLGVSHLFRDRGTKLRANFGTGFAAPRPIYVQGGPWYTANPELLPEESSGWDVGIDQSWGEGLATLSVTYFANDFENLFIYDFTIPGIVNTGLASSDGVEIALRYALTEGVTVNLAYTYSQATDDVRNVALVRRPEDILNAQVVWQATPTWTVGGGLSFAGGRFDGSAAAPVAVPDYTIMRFFTSLDLGHGLSARLRVENAFDESYEVVRGYPSLPLGVYGGFEWHF